MDVIEMEIMKNLRAENAHFQLEALEWKTEAKELWDEYWEWLNGDDTNANAFEDWKNIKYPELPTRERINLMLDFYKEQEANNDANNN